MKLRPALLLLLAALLASCAPSPTSVPLSTAAATATPRPTIYPTWTRLPTWTPRPTMPRLTPKPWPTSGPTETPLPTIAGDPLSVSAVQQRLEFVGHLGGWSKSVAIQGSYAYTIQENLLSIWDVSDPLHIAMVGTLGLGEKGAIIRFYIAGDKGYFVSEQETLYTVDLSDPATPVQLGSCQVETNQAMIVRQGYLYTFDVDAQLRVLDVRDPTICNKVASVQLAGPGGPLALDGDYLYAAINTVGMQILDVRDPAAPAVVGTWQQTTVRPGQFGAIVVASQYAYLAGRWSVYVVDISDPQDPAEVGFAPAGDAASMLAISGQYLYASDGELSTIRIDNPLSPDRLSDWKKGRIDAIAASGDLLYVVQGEQLHILKPTGRNSYEELVSYAGLADNRDLAAWGDFVYVIQGRDEPAGSVWGQMSIIGAADPARPYIAGTVPFTYIGNGAAAVNGQLYTVDIQCEIGAAACWGGLRLFNLSNPALPRLSAQHSLENIPADFGPDRQWGGIDVAVDEHYAYVLGTPFYGNMDPGDAYGLLVVDVSDPSAPKRVGTMLLPEGKGREDAWFGYDVQVEGGYAYAAAGEKGVRVIDVSNPAAPAEVGAFTEIPLAPHLAVAGRYAYVADKDGNIWILDISDPTHLARVECYALAWPVEYEGWGSYDYLVQHMLVSDNLLYVAAREAGLYVLDLSDPSSPALAAHYPAGAAVAVAVQGDLVYLLDSADGLSILRLGQ